MKAAEKVGAIFDRILGILAFVVAVLVAGMMLVVSVQVVLRHFFNQPVAWVIEVTQYALVFTLFLGTAWTLKKEAHVNIDVLVNHFSEKSRNLANGITSIICAIICGIITWYAVRLNWDYYQTRYIFAATLRIPAFTLQAVVPFGVLLLCIQFGRRAYGYLRKARER